MTRILSIEYSPPPTDITLGLDRPKIDRLTAIRTIHHHSRRLVASTVAVFRSPRHTLDSDQVDNWLADAYAPLQHYRRENEKHDDYVHVDYAKLRDFEFRLLNIQRNNATPHIKAKLFHQATSIITRYHQDNPKMH
ncbi:MAG: hypothetical protein EOO17_03430 [Chloroflexi bacterium]|nr:MAG: hypothetical protein EOO17_03430 [Chloroflexota bacterium]